MNTERKENKMSVFDGKVLMITGGTGSFGNAVLNRFLATDIGEIRIFSRDEKKQDDMRHEYQVKIPEVADKIKFYIGDVRDLQSCKNAMHGVDYIFHAAALKQVPSCEFFPMEAVKTNVIGTENVLTAAIEEGVESVICLSTDKAAYPINAMGITKAIEEKVAVAKSRMSGKTKICCTRYGNVMCSRGSVIPLWIDQIKDGNPITCEFFPMEAVKTNVIGTENVLTAAIEEGVESVICLSTDKAAYPINAMGITKAIEEKVAVAKSRMSGKTKICCTRYGNVMCSRGSVIPLWIDQIKDGNPITVTEPNMTRFIMSLDEAVDLVLFAFEHGENSMKQLILYYLHLNMVKMEIFLL